MLAWWACYFLESLFFVTVLHFGHARICPTPPKPFPTAVGCSSLLFKTHICYCVVSYRSVAVYAQNLFVGILWAVLAVWLVWYDGSFARCDDVSRMNSLCAYLPPRR